MATSSALTALYRFAISKQSEKETVANLLLSLANHDLSKNGKPLLSSDIRLTEEAQKVYASITEKEDAQKQRIASKRKAQRQRKKNPVSLTCFVKPTLEEVVSFFQESELFYANPQAFFDYYEKNGWTIDGDSNRPMKNFKDWTDTAKRWNKRNRKRAVSASKQATANPSKNGCQEQPPIAQKQQPPTAKKETSSTPSFEEVKAYFQANKYSVETAQSFFEKYEKSGWTIGGKIIYSWKRLADKWAVNGARKTPAELEREREEEIKRNLKKRNEEFMKACIEQGLIDRPKTEAELREEAEQGRKAWLEECKKQQQRIEQEKRERASDPKRKGYCDMTEKELEQLKAKWRKPFQELSTQQPPIAQTEEA